MTERLRICPWCVNVLNQNKLSVQGLRAAHRARLHAQRGTGAIEDHIAALTAQCSLASPYPALPDELFADLAMFRVRHEENRLLALWRTLSGGRARKARARAIEATLREAEGERERRAVDAHWREQAQINADIALHRSHLDRFDRAIEADVDAFFGAMRTPYRTHVMAVRLMRAYWLGLVSFDGSSGTRMDAHAFRALRARVLSEDGGRCRLCSSSAALHVHHVVALHACGTNLPANLVTLCADCHDKQHSFTITRRGRNHHGTYQ